MPRAYSVDLRQRSLRALASGLPATEVARRFDVSVMRVRSSAGPSNLDRRALSNDVPRVVAPWPCPLLLLTRPLGC